MKQWLRKNRGMILYAVFGGCTTLVDTAAYSLCFYRIGLPNVPSAVIAWILAVLFAFITNKIWVFESRKFDRKTIVKELVSFVGCRLATGALNVGVMFVCVDLLHWNAAACKLLSNIIVIILNYIFSRRIVFRK